MRFRSALFFTFVFLFILNSCSNPDKPSKEISAADILGNPDYPAFCFGGYRHNSREIVPSVEELKEDMKILAAMGVKIIRTYNTQQFAHAANLLKAIRQLKTENAEFEMYVMLGAWIDCEGAWTDSVNHNAEDFENNSLEINAAVDLAIEYPDIVKIIAVGNEAMVHWATSYFVRPGVILKWVNYLQDLKKSGEISPDILITSSDNFASWGGGSKDYHTDDLTKLIKAVDYISMHTYPFHDTHYNPSFWGTRSEEENLSDLEKIEASMVRAKEYALLQYKNTAAYIASLGIEKEIHIGETGWASTDASLYGVNGSRAADEYKQMLYFRHMRDWTNEAGITCFFFEAFDEKWKDANNAAGSENHFGLINLQGQAKYALWEQVDEGIFNGLTRNGQAITKSYGGNKKAMLENAFPPPSANETGITELATVNENRTPGEPVTEKFYVIVHPDLNPERTSNITYPSTNLKLNAWEGTCRMEMADNGVIDITTGTADWWGCALEMNLGEGENLTNFGNGHLNFEIKGTTNATFNIGFQTGIFAKGNQVNNQVTFEPGKKYSISENWSAYSIPVSELNNGGNLADVTVPLFLRGDKNFDGKHIYIKNIYYSR